MVLVLLDLLLQLVQGDLLVLNDQVDLQLLNTEADSDELAGAPDKTILLDGKNVGLELIQVGLIVPWLHVHTVHGQHCLLAIKERFNLRHDGLGSRLDLASLLLVVLGKTLGLELLGLLVNLIITAEQVDLIVVLLLGGCGSLGRVDGQLGLLRAVGSVVLGGVTRERGELGLPGEDVVVPAPCVGVLLRSGNSLQLLEDLDIGLRRCVAVEQGQLVWLEQ